MSGRRQKLVSKLNSLDESSKSHLSGSLLPKVTSFSLEKPSTGKFKSLPLSALLIFSLSFQSVCSANSLKCEDLFLSRASSRQQPKGVTPLSVEEKTAFIERAIRSRTINTFDGMEITTKEGLENKKLSRYISQLDFENLTTNELITILAKIQKLPMKLPKQIGMLMSRQGQLAEEDYNTAMIANELMNEALFEHVNAEGRFQDQSFFDHSYVYIRKFFAPVRMILTSINSAFSLIQVASFSKDFKAVFSPEIKVIKFDKLPDDHKLKVIFVGLQETKTETREILGLRSKVATRMQVVGKISNMVMTVIAMAFLADEFAKKAFGASGLSVLDDLIERGYFEEAIYQILAAEYDSSGIDYNEKDLREKIKKTDFRDLVRQIQGIKQ